MSLSFSAPRFDEVKAPIEECKEKDLTYCAPLFVTAEFTNHTTGEIKSQTVFMGDFPMMTPKGTFIINGTERVVVSQLVRSPGVYFTKEPDKTSDRDLTSVKVIPSRGAWLEFDIDKREPVGVRIDRKRRQAVTVLLRALGWDDERIRERFGWSELDDADPREGPHRRARTRPCSTSTASCVRASRRRARTPRRPARQPFFNEKRYDVAKVGRYKVNKKLEVDVPITTGVLTEEDVVAAIEYLVRLHAAKRATSRTTSTTSATVVCGRRRADPEPGPGWSVPHGARRSRAHDHAGRRGDHAADADQHPPGRGGDQGVLRNVAAVAVHGPDQPARGSDPPSPPLGARPGWSVT